MSDKELQSQGIAFIRQACKLLEATLVQMVTCDCPECRKHRALIASMIDAEVCERCGNRGEIGIHGCRACGRMAQS